MIMKTPCGEGRAGSARSSRGRGSGHWGWRDWWNVNRHLAEPLPGDAGAEFMIVSSLGQIAPKTAHDHESALQRGLAHGNAEVDVVGVTEDGARRFGRAGASGGRALRADGEAGQLDRPQIR